MSLRWEMEVDGAAGSLIQRFAAISSKAISRAEAGGGASSTR